MPRTIMVCPYCNCRLSVPSRKAGQLFSCPKCQYEVVGVASAVVLRVRDKTQESVNQDERTAISDNPKLVAGDTAAKPTTLSAPCPNCGTTLQVSGNSPEMKTHCLVCSAEFVATHPMVDTRSGRTSLKKMMVTMMSISLALLIGVFAPQILGKALAFLASLFS